MDEAARALLRPPESLGQQHHSLKANLAWRFHHLARKDEELRCRLSPRLTI